MASDATEADLLTRWLAPDDAERAFRVVDTATSAGRELVAACGLPWRGFDGAGDVEQYTAGFVRFADVSMALSLPPRADWVVSLEWYARSARVPGAVSCWLRQKEAVGNP